MTQRKNFFKTHKEFEKIYVINFNKMYALTRSTINDQGIAANLIYNIFIELWENRHSVQIQSAIEDHLIKTTKKAILKYYKDKVAHQQKVEQLVLKDNSNQTKLLHDLRDQLESSLDKLPQKCKQIFILSRCEGLKDEDIAKVLNIPLKTVEHQINRALKHLHKNLNI